MSFGKIYGSARNSRTKALLVVAKENNLDIELVETKAGTDSADYRKHNKLGKIPTFVGADGFTLHECIAIAVYLTSQNERTTLLGKTKKDYASILKWMSFANVEILVNAAGWLRPLVGEAPYNKKDVTAAEAATNAAAKVVDDYLLVNTFLVGERITLADYFLASLSSRAFATVFDKAWREKFPHYARWYETVVNQPSYKAAVPESILVDEAVKYTPPKAAPKEAKKEAPKPKPAVAAAAADDDEEEAKPAPKPKHPLEELGKPTFVLDDWKRKFRNSETREEALPWFWENMNFEEYSIWRVSYKYNDELTMTFMSSNLVGGFFARLEASRKYIQGCESVYGTNNDSIIDGAFVIRGQDAMKAFDVAPDWESYDFKKLDPTNAADKEFFNDQMAWDKPLVVNGKEYPHADGKIFV